MNRCVSLYLKVMVCACVMAISILLILSGIYGNLRFMFSINGLFVTVGLSAVMMMVASLIPFIVVFRKPEHYGVTKSAIAVINFALSMFLMVLGMVMSFALDVNGY